MKHEFPWVQAAGLLASAALLAGCASSPAEMAQKMPAGAKTAMQHASLAPQQKGLLRQDRNSNGVLDNNEQVLGVKTCGASACVVNVVVAATSLAELTESSDCKISLKDAADTSKNADVLVLTAAASQITWNVTPLAGTGLMFRFKLVPGTQSYGDGIQLYADLNKQVFGLSGDTAQQITLTRKVVMPGQAFAYGVYLEWRSEAAGGEYTSCNPFDPIIIEHN